MKNCNYIKFTIIFLKINNRKFVENNEKDYIEKARNLYAIDRVSDFFINIEISDLLKVGGIIEVLYGIFASSNSYPV